MTDKYSVSVAASSEQAKDWGRALADAVSQMVEHFAADAGPQHDGVFGKDLHLRILPNRPGDGVEITVSWDPADEDDVQA